MTVDYRESHLGTAKARSYDRQFRDNPYRSMMWRLEKEYLLRAINHFLGTKCCNYLDFACGTGRVIETVSRVAENSVGIDVSEDMLSLARAACPDCEFINADITSDEFYERRSFDLITAFRFFPNAQDELRNSALRALMPLMNKDGIFVFNNHKNSSSLIYKASRAIPWVSSRSGMSSEEVYEILDRHGLKVILEFGIGKIPSSDKYRILPSFIIEALERAFSRIGLFHRISSNIIYVCQRKIDDGTR